MPHAYQEAEAEFPCRSEELLLKEHHFWRRPWQRWSFIFYGILIDLIDDQGAFFLAR